MKIKYISESAPHELADWLKSQGYSVSLVAAAPNMTTSIASHADIRMCRLGCYDDSPIFKAKASDLSSLRDGYPNDVSFNAACTGKYFIHNFKYTNPSLFNAVHRAIARSEDFATFSSDPSKVIEQAMNSCKQAAYSRSPHQSLQLHEIESADQAHTKITPPQLRSEAYMINVKQGYSKCSIVIVDEDSIITYDNGIANACEHAGMNVLRIRPGYVALAGYKTGFIGGASGRVGDTIVFCGDISAHPDSTAITEFIQERGLNIKSFSFPLTDIGSII